MAETFEHARSTILTNIAQLPAEKVFLLDAAGRVLAEDIIAPWDMPRWDNSAMDGYAIRACDGHAGTRLRVEGFIPAGGTAEGITVLAGHAIKIMTGAPVPQGCEAVIPVENTKETEGAIVIVDPVGDGAHIRRRGEDIQRGEKILERGTALHARHINLLASLGYAQVAVTQRPRVAILSTGDELVEVGEPLGAGQIINSNSYSLAAAVREAGGVPIMLGIALDTRESLREKVAAGLRADMLITSAGVSAGDLDLVREILEEAGVQQLFWKVNIKPGRPTAFGMAGAVPVFSLPGNPVSTLITFEVFVRPALRMMMGQREVLRPMRTARLSGRVKKMEGRCEFLRVFVTEEPDGTLIATSSGDQNTGILKTMVRANGVAILPEAAGSLEAGATISLFLLQPNEALPGTS